MVTTWNTVASPTTSWTDVPISTGSNTVINGGEPIGLLLALTYAGTIIIPNDPWTQVPNGSGTSWTSVPKAT